MTLKVDGGRHLVEQQNRETRAGAACGVEMRTRTDGTEMTAANDNRRGSDKGPLRAACPSAGHMDVKGERPLGTTNDRDADWA